MSAGAYLEQRRDERGQCAVAQLIERVVVEASVQDLQRGQVGGKRGVVDQLRQQPSQAAWHTDAIQ